MASENFRPFSVRAWMRSAVVSDPYLPLDGILFYQKNRELYGYQEATVPGRYSRSQAMDTILPLGIVHPGEPTWYYRCSWAVWGPYVEGSDAWNKRFDVSLASLIGTGKGQGTVITSQGRYKLYHVPIFYRFALWIEWYCVGDMDEVGALLAVTTHIGKKTAQGWGNVIRWEIQPIPDDWSIWKDGRLMRGIPPSDVPKEQIINYALYGIRPSYWLKENQMWLAMP